LIVEDTAATSASSTLAAPIRGDAFGALLMACWQAGAQPGKVLEFVERDDGYLDAGDAARYFSELDAWGPLGTWACAQVRGRVLDIGSGAGRHSLHLQQQGFDVVALDISPLATEVCRRRGIQNVMTGTVFDLAQQGVQPFDSFLMLGNNLGLLRDAANAQKLLGALAQLAAPGAGIIGEGMDPYRTTNPLLLAYHQRNRDLGRLPGQIRMRVRHQNLATDWFDYLFTTIEELTQLLRGTPWQLDRYETNGASYVARLVFVA
jgi:SAM-dependent methyltransferase